MNIARIINLEGHLNCFIGSKVTEILVNGGFCLRVVLQLQAAQQADNLVKGCLSIKVLVKALEAVEAGKKLPFFKYLLPIFFFGKTLFFKILLTQH